jgi:hypothetical protein
MGSRALLSTDDLRMSGSPRRAAIRGRKFALRLLFFAFAMSQFAVRGGSQQAAAPMVLDRVVAVVNNRAILSSDLDDEIRLSVVDPGRGGLGALTRLQALDQLIGRALVEQQISPEDAQAASPSATEIATRLKEIRKELPACVRENCASDAGWKAFLDAHGLTQQQVETYFTERIEILRFIEQRFRQGVRIPPEEVSTYYHNTLIPQYAKGEAIPPLDQVSSRIEEILLQQRVNVVFDDWLNNLRKQGEIEVLDPDLEQAPQPDARPSSAARQIAPAAAPVSPSSSLNLPLLTRPVRIPATGGGGQ